MSNKTSHVMIDLETMGLIPQSAIVSIGAVRFDPRFGIKNAGTFYEELDWKDQELMYDRYIDKETEAWWSRQNSRAQEALNGIGDLKDTLEAFSKWLPRDVKVWGNGAGFDIVMLEDAYRKCGLEIPWKYYNVRDCRTVKEMYEATRSGLTVNNVGTHHNALDDAKYQVNYIVEMWKVLVGAK